MFYSERDVLVVLIFLIYTAAVFLSRRSNEKSDIPRVTTLIPWLGAGLKFAYDFPRYGMAIVHKYGPNFRIKLAGQRFIFISAPDALDVFFRNRANNLVVGMIHSIAPAQIGGVHNAAAVHVVDAVLIPVIIKGNTDPALATFVPAFNAEMAAYLAHTHLAARARGVGVEHLATHGLFTCMWLAMFGPRFPVEIYADFLTIDKATHTLLNSLPVFGSAVPTARERMRAALNTYLQPWRDTNGEEDIDGVSCHGNDVMRALVTSGLTEFEQAGLLLTYVWGSSTNLTRVSAWLLAHLLADRAAYARLQAEIDAGCAAEYASTEALLRAHPRTVNGPSFPLLDSALKEVSRLHLLPMSHRLVADAVEFPAAGGGGATFAAAKGDHVMANITGIHWNETKFADPRVFQLDRFTAGDGVRYLYIWGRGAQICPGRHMATYYMKMFTILLLRHYDVAYVPKAGEPFALPAENPRSSGIMRMASDFNVALTPRNVKA